MGRLVNTNPKSRVLLRPRGSYLRCKEREGPERHGTLDTRLLGKSYQKLTFTCDPMSVA